MLLEISGMYLAGRSALDIMGMGDVCIRVHSDSIWKLQKVRHVPELNENLISVGQWMKKGILLAFTVVSGKLAREPGFWLVDIRQVLSI
jgi:hypothetical protein